MDELNTIVCADVFFDTERQFFYLILFEQGNDRIHSYRAVTGNIIFEPLSGRFWHDKEGARTPRIDRID